MKVGCRRHAACLTVLFNHLLMMLMDTSLNIFAIFTFSVLKCFLKIIKFM